MSKQIVIVISTFLIIFFAIALKTTKVHAESAALDFLSDLLSAGEPDRYHVDHIVSFTLPEDAQVVTPTDWIRIDLSHFNNVTGANFVGGQFGGTPSFSKDGTVVKITGISIVPGNEISIQGITADNPHSIDLYSFTVTISEDEAGTIVKNVGNAYAAAFQGGINMTATVSVPSARIIVSGHTAPQTQVYFTEGGPVMGTTFAGLDGYYSKLFSGLEPGTHYLGVHGLDVNSLNTSIINLSVYAPVYQTTNVYNLLLSPTLRINTTSILQGDRLIASGSAYPNTAITLFTDAPVRSYTATTSAAGNWTKTITNSEDYSVGDYRIYAIAQRSNGIQSLFSPSRIFTVVSSSSGGGAACGDISQGDLNCDEIVDLSDFSILMYYWGTTNATADINGDGLVDLTDFSVMMYYWGT